MKRLLISLITLLALSALAEVPASVKRAVKQVNDAATLKVNCAINGNAASMTISGNCFIINLKDASVHYDGTTQWAYNAADREVTIINPTDEELAETNPLHILRSLERKFDGAPVKGKPNTVRLTPKSTHSDIAEVTITFNPSTGWPTDMTIVSASGRADISSLSFSSSKTKTAPTAFKFQTPKGTTTTDLR